jgi:hypothetical protein
LNTHSAEVPHRLSRALEPNSPPDHPRGDTRGRGEHSVERSLAGDCLLLVPKGEKSAPPSPVFCIPRQLHCIGPGSQCHQPTSRPLRFSAIERLYALGFWTRSFAEHHRGRATAPFKPCLRLVEAVNTSTRRAHGLITQRGLTFLKDLSAFIADRGLR